MLKRPLISALVLILFLSAAATVALVIRQGVGHELAVVGQSVCFEPIPELVARYERYSRERLVSPEYHQDLLDAITDELPRGVELRGQLGRSLNAIHGIGHLRIQLPELGTLRRELSGKRTLESEGSTPAHQSAVRLNQRLEQRARSVSQQQLRRLVKELTELDQKREELARMNQELRIQYGLNVSRGLESETIAEDSPEGLRLAQLALEKLEAVAKTGGFDEWPSTRALVLGEEWRTTGIRYFRWVINVHELDELEHRLARLPTAEEHAEVLERFRQIELELGLRFGLRLQVSEYDRKIMAPISTDWYEQLLEGLDSHPVLAQDIKVVSIRSHPHHPAGVALQGDRVVIDASRPLDRALAELAELARETRIDPDTEPHRVLTRKIAEIQRDLGIHIVPAAKQAMAEQISQVNGIRAQLESCASEARAGVERIDLTEAGGALVLNECHRVSIPAWKDRVALESACQEVTSALDELSSLRTRTRELGLKISKALARHIPTRPGRDVSLRQAAVALEALHQVTEPLARSQGEVGGRYLDAKEFDRIEIRSDRWFTEPRPMQIFNRTLWIPIGLSSSELKSALETLEPDPGQLRNIERFRVRMKKERAEHGEDW